MNNGLGRRNAGWISTLVALVALVVVGFLGGALAGFLWEEPGLVLAYLSGKTEPVAFEEPAVGAEPPGFSEPADLPAVPEPEPEVVNDGPETIAPAKPAAPSEARAVEPAVEQKPVEPKPVVAPAKPAPAKPAPAKVAAATPAGRFSVQVGAFADRASADKLVSRLKGRGYTPYVKADGDGSMKRFRVRVGPVNGRPRAEELVRKLKGEKLPGWIVDESKG